MLLSPLINTGIRGLPDKELYFTTIVLFIAMLYFSLVWKSTIIDNGRSVVYFVILYLIGAVIKRLDLCNIVNTRKLQIGGGLLTIIALTFIVPMAYQKLLKGIVFFYVSPILLFCAIYFFLLFSKIKVQNRVINYIASSSFAIYLFHENYWTHDFFYGIVEMIINNFDGVNQIFIACIFVVILSVVVVLWIKLYVYLFQN